MLKTKLTVLELELKDNLKYMFSFIQCAANVETNIEAIF